MQKLMSASPPAGFTFSDNGTFAILLTTPFGEPMISELKARLRDVDRLRSFTTILQQRKLKLIESSLQQVKFQYGQDFKASVNFGQENDIQVHLSAGNPHNRIRTFLTEIINERSPFFLPGQERKGLDRFCETLLFTRPILSILTRLENAIPGNLHNPAVKAHHVGNYRITYANPLCSFDIKLRAKEDKACWHIEDNIKRQPDSRPSSERNPNHKRLESLQVALNTLFKKRETGWYGIRAGILADIDGIPGALRALHQTVMACAVDVGSGVLPYVDTSTSGSVPAPAPQTNGNANGNGNVNAQGAPAPTANMGVQPQVNGMQGRKNFPNVGKPTKKERDVIEID
jgi:mediator of RNA polymerase II transcription subunit 14